MRTFNRFVAATVVLAGVSLAPIHASATPMLIGDIAAPDLVIDSRPTLLTIGPGSLEPP